MLDYDYTRNAIRSRAEMNDWHARHGEPVLEPELPIIDAHHHIWTHPGREYSAEDMLANANLGHNIVATVFIEGSSQHLSDGPVELRPTGETGFVVRNVSCLPEKGDRIAAAIVGHADLRLGKGLAPVLDAHIALAGGRFRGIRQHLRWDASGIGMFGRADPAHLAADAAFRAGFSLLASRQLSFDAWAFHHQLDEIADLARAFPDTTVIVNHVGGPLGVGPYSNRRNEIFLEWREGIKALAGCPNVAMKLGGLGMLYYGFGFHRRDTPPNSLDLASAWRPYVMTCIDCFGVGRCMFESNFPVDGQSTSYLVLWNAFKRITKDFTAEEKLDLYCRSAASAYKITSTKF
ncbi:amidohydrolase family protein [Bosea sp. BK604]|uniref:amidohydrolase family protein n=1 Tax=Bosea sp. BK604 TaxID=2512180 RepID=UPI0010506037|nr:amidohydrolase family protein [Bosea sp. BK604]TCR68633.1 putative TIM-barrel fold metal-dependent hydrolase [Bosea sp. BK604]